MAIGLSATACNGFNIDPGILGAGGTDDSAAASTTGGDSSSSQGGGSATAGTGGEGGSSTTAGTGGDGGTGGGSTTAGTGGDGGTGGGSTTAGTGGDGGTGGGSTTAGTGGDGGASTTAGTGGAGGDGGGSTTAGTGGAGGDGGGSTTAGTGGAPPLDPACGPDTATFADVLPILERSCSTCHGNPAFLAGGLDLRASEAVGAMVNQDASSCSREQALVVPFMPSSSYLMNKLKETGLCDPDESKMPPGASLPEAEIKTINDWICAGAPEN
ncbi:hypothetical protein WMF04_29220 [Sorangium sp. So ce260]|uniref:hypothetical protein n=1 Tax=Sorangium sp. So ce260 TaxID=3133291 RepID=UPI003F5E685D